MTFVITSDFSNKYLNSRKCKHHPSRLVFAICGQVYFSLIVLMYLNKLYFGLYNWSVYTELFAVKASLVRIQSSVGRAGGRGFEP